MSFLFVTVTLAVGLALVSGGSLRSIAATEVRHPGVLAGAVGIQLGLEVVHPLRGTAGHLASALLVVSYAFLLFFCALNFRLRGLAVGAGGMAPPRDALPLARGIP